MAVKTVTCKTRRCCENAEFAPDLTAPYHARTFVRRTLSLWGVSDTDTAALVVTELVTNSIMSSAVVPEIEVRLSLGVRLFVSVWDGDPSPPCHTARTRAARRSIADLDRRRANLIASLEAGDSSSPGFLRDVRVRYAEVEASRAVLQAELDTLEAHVPATPDLTLVDQLPIGPVDIMGLADPLRRQLFDAFRLQIHYHRLTRTATCCVTIAGPLVEHLRQLAHDAGIAGNVPICDVHLVGALTHPT